MEEKESTIVSHLKESIVCFRDVCRIPVQVFLLQLFIDQTAPLFSTWLKVD